MSGVCVALALETTLDMAAIRRLHDYGDLDDVGVTSAFEQTRLQQFGHVQVPDYLRAITQAAAVIDEAGDVRLAEFEAEPDEAALLQALAQRLPAPIETLVCWDGRDAALPGVRAFVHDQTIGHTIDDALRNDAVFVLADRLGGAADDPLAAATGAEAEIVCLVGMSVSPSFAVSGNRAVVTAINRYRLWLRWQASRGAITRDARQAREYALTAAVDNTNTIRA